MLNINFTNSKTTGMFGVYNFIRNFAISRFKYKQFNNDYGKTTNIINLTRVLLSLR